MSGERSRSVSLPVVGADRRRVRRSRMSRRRAVALTIVHLLMIAHVGHWLLTGRTVSPIEPSEAMYTLNQGYLNAGAIFFAAAILATLVLGRFVCGWGCHLVAYQDLCAWLLRRVGIHPKPFRSRLLVLAPLALAIYMFVWPTAYRWWMGGARPPLVDHLVTTEFWATFPGWGIALLTFGVCGFGIVYLLGGKGFCTYACPYGGLFGVADRLATGRIRVTNACAGCGHCTAVCTSNVRVHDEVARYGMVVDPGCMKCMDCVSVCPNDALYFGFGRPAARTPASRPPRQAKLYDFSAAEELAMALVGVAALLSYRGLYGKIPLLLAMGMAGITAFVGMKCVHLIRLPNVRLQNLSLKRGSRLSLAGWCFAAGAAVLFVFAVHSGAVRWEAMRGRQMLQGLALGDAIWAEGYDWYAEASLGSRLGLDGAIGRLERADEWGLAATPTVLTDLVWAYVARGRLEEAERRVRRVMAQSPDEPDPRRGLAAVLRKGGRVEEALAAYRAVLELDPGYSMARRELSGLLVSRGRTEEAVAVYRSALEVTPDDTSVVVDLADLLARIGRPVEAIDVLERHTGDTGPSDRALTALGIACLAAGRTEEGVDRLMEAIRRNPADADAQYNLGMVSLQRRRIDEAIDHLERAVGANPNLSLGWYNLAVARFMSGRAAAALGSIRTAIRLTPDDPSVYGFLAEVLRELGDPVGASAASERARALMRRE
jgi:Flp pilus assembly protein TadD/polyferredoxin